MFDYARLGGGRLVERTQQSDTLSRIRQMHAGTAKKAVAFGGLLGAAALFRAIRHRTRALADTRFPNGMMSPKRHQ